MGDGPRLDDPLKRLVGSVAKKSGSIIGWKIPSHFVIDLTQVDNVYTQQFLSNVYGTAIELNVQTKLRAYNFVKHVDDLTCILSKTSSWWEWIRPNLLTKSS